MCVIRYGLSKDGAATVVNPEDFYRYAHTVECLSVKLESKVSVS